jgi:hypothetical protein
MWDRALYRHQPLAEILLNTGFYPNGHYEFSRTCPSATAQQ